MLRLRGVLENEERTFPLAGEEMFVGRSGDNHVVLPDPSVSRRHAVLRYQKDTWWIQDLESTNGILLNGSAVLEARLAPGDRLGVGIFELVVEEGEVKEVDEETLSATFPSATVIRRLSDFKADYGLEGAAPALEEQRRTLEEGYSSKVFGFLTRLAQGLIIAPSVDEVLAKVMEISFEALPVERGFILLKDEQGDSVCELARFAERVEFRPQSEVPVSETMLEQVMSNKVALLTLDAQSDQRLSGGESIRIHQIRAAMCAPLWSGEKIIGVLQVDTHTHTGTFSEGDLDFLTTLANYAAVAVERLRYAETVEEERRVRSHLERYHSPAVIEDFLRKGDVAGEQRGLRQLEATVLFADLVGFTALAENLPPGDVATLLEGYFSQAVDAIFSAGGTLDKFIGDCVMAFFGAPVEHPDHALRAVRAALEIRQGLARWNASREAEGLPPVEARVALNSGPVVVGDIGNERRVDYTVLGNTVNVAARLEQFVASPGDVVLGPETAGLVKDEIPLEEMGQFQLKGLEKKVTVWRVKENREAVKE